MIVSHGRKFIFVHIPKTGGTALSLALEQRAMADDILIGDTPKAKRRRKRVAALQTSGRLWKHSRLTDIEDVVGRAAFNAYFVFTLVRNPWDRAVSTYHWLRQQTFDHPTTRLAKAVDFTSFLNDAYFLRSFAHPYAHFVEDKAGVEQPAHFFRLERLDEELVPLWDHLGFNLNPIAPANVSPRKRDYRSYFTDADQETIARVCADDIARFGYGFTASGFAN